MALLKQYVVNETLKVFCVTIGITLLLLTLGGGIREGIRQGLPPALVLKTMPYLVPEMLRFTVPGALLFAVCSVFGRMTAANELSAVKSLGINPLCLVWPVLILAWLLGVATYGLYDVCASWSRPGMRRLITDAMDRIAYGYLRSNGAFSSGGVSIVVKGVEHQRLVQPVITLDPRGDSPRVMLSAKEARLAADPARGALRVECRDGSVQYGTRGSYSFDRFVHEVILQEPLAATEDCLSPSALPSRSIARQIRHAEEQIAELQTQSTATDPAEAEEGAALKQRLHECRTRLFRLQAEVPRRMANGLSCVCFALVGIPIAMGRRSGDTMSVFFVCFLPILVLYYPLLVVGENLARGGLLPHVSVWLGDTVLALIGGLLLWHRTRR